MSEITSDLAELCTILNRRNELNRARHAARRHHRQASQALKSKRVAAEKVRLERFGDVQRNSTWRTFQTMKACCAKIPYTTYTIREQITAWEMDFGARMRVARERASQMSAEPVRPRRLACMSNADLRAEECRCEIAHATVRLQLMEHTKKYKAVVRELCKRNGWSISTCSFDSVVIGVRAADKSWVVRGPQVAEIAATSLVESAIKGEL